MTRTADSVLGFNMPNETDQKPELLKPLAWTEHRPPCKEVPYDHCIAETAFGRFLLTWKSWKTEAWQSMGVGFDETPWGDVWYDSWDDPSEAKQAALDELTSRVASMLVLGESSSPCSVLPGNASTRDCVESKEL